MILHHWLEEIMDSKSKIRILRIFFRHQDREFTEREVAELVKMSPNTVNLAFRDLRKTNILHFRKIGRAHVYKLNKDSPLWHVVHEIFFIENELFANLLPLIGKEMKGTLSCVLYGSFARGTEEWDSDMDLLIISDDRKTKMKLDKLKELIIEGYGTRLSAVVVSYAQFRRMWKKPLIQNAMKDGILVSGVPLEEAYAKTGNN
jgi:predicted nucleotidyltransferase